MSSKAATAKDRVLEAATELFSRRGFAGTSMQDVADALGVRKPSLYKHVSGKDELYSEVLDRALKPFSIAIENALGDPSDSEAVRRLPLVAMRRLHEQPQAARLLLQEIVQLDTDTNPELNRWLKQLFIQTDGVLARAFPEVRDSAQVRLVWVAMLNMALGFVAASPLLPADELAAQDLLNREAKLLATVLNSLRSSLDHRKPGRQHGKSC